MPVDSLYCTVYESIAGALICAAVVRAVKETCILEEVTVPEVGVVIMTGTSWTIVPAALCVELADQPIAFSDATIAMTLDP